MLSKTGPLDVAFCDYCGTRYTRDEIKARIWPSRRCFSCDCGMEWNGKQMRPLTIQEMINGRRAGLSYGVDVSVIVRCVVQVLQETK